MSDQGPIVVELAARGAGFKVFTEILPKITGIDTVQCSIEMALGKSPNINTSEAFLCASLVFIPPLIGRLKHVSGVNEARCMSSIYEVKMHKKIGDVLRPLRSGADRAGHVLAFDKDALKCINSAKRALNMIKLEVEELR